MFRLFECYRQYRQVGFRRIDAIRLAWLVTMAGARPVALRDYRR
jgi:hypothetical protein